MNWGAPIGFGKAGNNPYAMADMGLGLTFGKQEGGLAGMLTGNQPWSNDQRALVESLAAGQALDEVPREGLFPQLLAKTGIISPNVKVSPSIHALEELAVRQQAEQRMTDQLATVTGLSTIAEHGGPGMLSWAYKNIPGLAGLIPGLDPASIKTPQMITEAKNLAMIQAQGLKEQNQEQALALRQQQIDNQFTESQRRMDIQQGAEQAMWARLNRTETDKDRSDSLKKYNALIGQLSSDRRTGTMQDPTPVLNYMRAEAAKGTPYEVAYFNAYNDPRFAPILQSGLQPPQETDSGPGMWSKIGEFFGVPGTDVGGAGTANAAPGAAPNASATPTIVQPKSFMK